MSDPAALGLSPHHMQSTYFHLAPIRLGAGSTILPGNWGRLLRAWGTRHVFGVREQVLESIRMAAFSHLPSRYNCCFVWQTRGEAELNRREVTGFSHNVLYRVRLTKPEIPVFIADSMCATALHEHPLVKAFAYTYWSGSRAGVVTPVEGSVHHVEPPIWEGLTRSPVVIEECLDPLDPIL